MNEFYKLQRDLLRSIRDQDSYVQNVVLSEDFIMENVYDVLLRGIYRLSTSFEFLLHKELRNE